MNVFVAASTAAINQLRRGLLWVTGRKPSAKPTPQGVEQAWPNHYKLGRAHAIVGQRPLLETEAYLRGYAAGQGASRCQRRCTTRVSI